MSKSEGINHCNYSLTEKNGKNIRSACSCHAFYHFINRTRNHQTQFGTVIVKNWIGGDNCKRYTINGYRGFDRYDVKECE